MNNSKGNYIVVLVFSACFFWFFYLRIIYDSIYTTYFERNFLTQVIHGFISVSELSEYKLKFICVFLAICTGYFLKVYDKKKYSKDRLLIYIAISGFFIFLPNKFFSLFPELFGVIINISSFPLFFCNVVLLGIHNYSRKIDKDRFNEENQSFMQETEVIKSEDSLNFYYKFYYNNKEYSGVINIVEVFRSIWVYGTMGSGKTFTFMVPMIYHLMKKDFCLAVYDCKFPSLSKKTYNFYKSLCPEAEYYQLCFTDMRFSNKCNFLEPKYIPSDTEIKSIAKTIMANLSEGKRENPFFEGSATSVLAAIIAINKKMQFKYNLEVSSLPHAIILSCVKIKYLIPILLADKDTMVYVTTLRDAYNNGAAEEQLVGQTSTLQQKISELFNKDFMFLASGKSDFSLDLNDPNHKKILTVGADSRKAQAVSPFTSLTFEIISNKTNAPNKHKFMKIIDEFPQLYYNSFSQYLEIGRENKCGVAAGCQGITQLYKKRPREVADSILEVQGTVIAGLSGEKTASLVSRRIGKANQIRNSLSSNNDILNQSFHEAPLVPVSRISNFSTGEFAGTVVDEHDNKIKQKRFIGDFSKDMEVYSVSFDDDIPMIHSFDNPKTRDAIAFHLEELANCSFNALYKKAVLNNSLDGLSDNILFYLDLLKIDDMVLFSEHKFIKNSLKDLSFSIDKYIASFVSERLKTVILDNEKDYFLNLHIDNIYNDIETWVKKEYFELTGNVITEDLFKIDNFTPIEKDNLSLSEL